MSLAQRAGKSGVIAELALARAQRNTVVIVDDLFSSRLLLAEIVRQIDGKLNLELFDTPSRALEFCRNNRDRKSTRLNSSHSQISYAVFCLKKKKDNHHEYNIVKDLTEGYPLTPNSPPR